MNTNIHTQINFTESYKYLVVTALGYPQVVF